MAGQDITLSTPDGDFGGYLAQPASGRGPGIVVIQEIFGVNEFVRATADQFLPSTGIEARSIAQLHWVHRQLKSLAWYLYLDICIILLILSVSTLTPTTSVPPKP